MKKNKKPKVVDPPRYPLVINGYENEAKKIGTDFITQTMIEITKQMVKEVKENK